METQWDNQGSGGNDHQCHDVAVPTLVRWLSVESQPPPYTPGFSTCQKVSYGLTGCERIV